MPDAFQSAVCSHRLSPEGKDQEDRCPSPPARTLSSESEQDPEGEVLAQEPTENAAPRARFEGPQLTKHLLAGVEVGREVTLSKIQLAGAGQPSGTTLPTSAHVFNGTLSPHASP